jgi:hypothetical protein
MRRMRSVCVAAALCLVSCSLPRVVAELDDQGPAPDLGRPALVRDAASFGAWVGGAAGAVASIVTLPVTFLITVVDDEPFGYDRELFLFAPVSLGASAGHYLFGAPLDSLDFLVRRAWVDAGAVDVFEQPPPEGPKPPDPDSLDVLLGGGRPTAPDGAAEQPREPDGEGR